MLAVQQAPRMGPTQPDSDPMSFFGYSVDSSSQPENIFDGAPEPAPGAPLLSETDSKFLSSFFEDITSNQFTVPSFGEGLNFSDAWLDLPPQFMGSSTSFGQQEASAEYGFSHDQQNDVSRMMPSGSGLMPPPPPLPAAPSQPHLFSEQHSDDVLNAAANLLRNGSRAGSSKSPAASGSTGNQTNDPNGRRQPAYPVGHLRHQPMEEFREENRRGSHGANIDQTFTQWMWGSKEKTPIQRPLPGDFQWGSDASFTDIQGYVPEPQKESVESMHQTQMKCLECLEVNQSAVNTRPGSPANGQPANSNVDTSVPIKREEDLNAPPRKRRKSKNVRGAGDEDDEDDDDASNLKSGRKRRTKSERSASGSEPPSDITSAATASSRRRKSGVNGAKIARENLTEEQKRENHIRSEQKRRTLIKEGFDDLGDLVPGLKSGGFSKSTTLSMAAEWLDELLQGNKALAMQLSNLERR